jgi:hypothetical protein
MENKENKESRKQRRRRKCKALKNGNLLQVMTDILKKIINREGGKEHIPFLKNCIEEIKSNNEELTIPIIIDSCPLNLEIKRCETENCPCVILTFISSLLIEECTPLKRPRTFLHTSFKDVPVTAENLYHILTTYRVHDGLLIEKEDSEIFNLRDQFFPIPEDLSCSICHKKTYEKTICQHYLCMPCRVDKLIKDDKKCSICEEECLHIYKLTPAFKYPGSEDSQFIDEL